MHAGMEPYAHAQVEHLSTRPDWDSLKNVATALAETVRNIYHGLQLDAEVESASASFGERLPTLSFLNHSIHMDVCLLLIIARRGFASAMCRGCRRRPAGHDCLGAPCIEVRQLAAHDSNGTCACCFAITASAN